MRRGTGRGRPTIASTSRMASVGRRDRVASDAEEKTLTPMASCVSRPRIVFGSSEPVGSRGRSGVGSLRGRRCVVGFVLTRPERVAQAEVARRRWKGRARPGLRTRSSPPRMSVPTRPASSANTGPAHAPTKTQIAAPENQVTRARATPKKPNCASFFVTRSGIHIVADTANPAIATPVITPVGSAPVGARRRAGGTRR